MRTSEVDKYSVEGEMQTKYVYTSFRELELRDEVLEEHEVLCTVQASPDPSML